LRLISIWHMKKQVDSKTQLNDFEQVFWALSHQSRRQIMNYLNESNGTSTVANIVNEVQLAWSTTSAHLKVLVEAQLLTVKREGREQIYSLNSKRLKVISDWLKKFND
jgi:ArsR family transcriptional regulator, arsenate/arsenite/antimonite-responsive transcriptional repressor